MMLARLTLLVLAAGIAACGEPKALACDDGPYLTAVRGAKVVSPDGLDGLNPLAEVPLPAASPQAQQGPRPEGSPCLEYPPRIIRIE